MLIMAWIIVLIPIILGSLFGLGIILIHISIFFDLLSVLVVFAYSMCLEYLLEYYSLVDRGFLK